MTEFRILELFSGIGGMHEAFQYTQLSGTVLAAMDINTVANLVYAHNHPATPVLNNNIQRLTQRQIDKLGINMLLMSPPCQPFTRVGNQRDVDDNRTDALKHLCELLPQCSSLQYVLMENVKGFETSRARDCYVKALKAAGYHVREFILSPTQFGVPNTRHRYYCLARKGKDFAFNDKQIWETMPVEFRQALITPVGNVLQEEAEISSEVYLDEKVLSKRVWLMDIVNAAACNSICFTKAYTHYSEGTGSVFTTANEQELCETFQQLKKQQQYEQTEESLAANMLLLKRLRLRYFTPREVARLMSFPETFTFPRETTTRQKYRLLGNSINVLVVAELIKLLCAE